MLRRRWLRHARVLKVEDGDTIVIGCPTFLSGDQRARVRAIVREVFPSNHVLVLDGQMDLRVVRRRGGDG